MSTLANECRKDILDEVYFAQSGHIGGSLSCIDIVANIYANHLNYDRNNFGWEDRDRFVLSKGHATPALYSVFAELGFISKDELKTFRQIDTRLQGHPSMRKLPMIDASTGSLGQGLSIANGMALAGKLDKKEYYVYCLMGDGEMQEGQVWEAFMTSAKYCLDNLIVFVDKNGLQIDGKVADIMNIDDLEMKLKSFNWNVIVIDGHDDNQINESINQAKQCKGKPTIIIANTVKGKGVSFMENNFAWHGKAPNEAEYIKAKSELEENI